MSAARSLRELYRNRRAEIAAAVKDRPKDSLDAIGKEYGITRERVRQIAKLYGIERRPKDQLSAL